MLTDLIKNKKEPEAILLFKSQPFDLNFKDKHHKTILMYTCEYRMHDLLDLLLEQYKKDSTFNLNILDSYDQTALYYACDDTQVIEKLILAGMDLDSMNKDLLTVLNYCASHNLNKSVATLLKYSPSLIYTDRLRRTPLIWAAKLNNRNMFAALLEAGVDPDKIDESGMSCLNYVIDQNDNSMIDALIKHKANINLTNELGRTALHHAAQFNRIYVIHNLIKKGIDINLLDNRHKTALMYACDNEHMDLAKILITHGAKFSFINLYDRKGFKAIADNMHMFQFLLAHTTRDITLIEYQNILDKLEGNYSAHIQLINTTLLNQRLGKSLYKLDYIEEKKTKI